MTSWGAASHDGRRDASPRVRRSAWREACVLLNRQRGPLALGLCCMVVNRGAALVLPLSAKVVIDDVVGRGRTGLLLPLAAAVLSAVVLEAASGFALTHVVGVAAQRAIAGLRTELAARTLRFPVRHHDSTSSGALAARIMTDPEQLRYVLGPGFVQLASGLLTAAFALGVLGYLHLPLTAAVLVLMVLFVAGLTRGFRRLYATFEAGNRLTADLTGRLAEAFGGVTVIKTFVAERREALRFARESHRLLRHAATTVRGVAVYTGASSIATGVVGVLVLVVGGHAVATGAMTVGELVLYLLFIGLLWMPVIEVAAIASELGKAAAALGRIAELRALPTEEMEDRHRLPVAMVEGAITFDQVWFTYPDGRAALHGVTFHVPASSMVALVGPTGAGKSTTAQLVAALRAPTAGRVLIDGRDLSSLRRREYRRFLAMVPQELVLFDGTIADNISYARPDASKDHVRRAVRLAHCEEFMTSLPDGYATVVGEDGMWLSAGQRQRVAIARAILADPRILILDEPTSHLDAESEALIQDALATLCHGRTVLVIAHRLGTVRRADQVLVLERGTIIERGTHAELLGQRGRYRDLYEMQMRRETEESVAQGWRPARVPDRFELAPAEGAAPRENSRGR